MKKIFTVFLSCLFLGYTIFVGYQYFNNTHNLNALIKMKVSLQNDIRTTDKKIRELENTLTNIKAEKENVKNQITENETAITQTSSNINAKQAAYLARQQRLKAEQAKYRIISGSGSKMAYLTFDDGPSGYTNKVLDILQEYGIKATFFVNGRSDSNSLNLYRRIVNDGHSIGNHTYSHKYANIYTSANNYDYDFNLLQQLIYNTTGVTMDIMRFPGGSNNGVSNSYSYGIMNTLTTRYSNLGYKYFDWNSSAGDTGAGVTTASVISKITGECRYKNFVIILMHDSMWTTPLALPSVIQNLTDYGFKFGALTNSTPAIQFN